MPSFSASRLGAAVTEDVGALPALGAHEIAHVLDDAEHRHIDLAEHVEALAGIDQRQVLRGRDDDGARQRHLLGHGELHVARAGRHVDDEHVEVAPVDVAQHLGQRRDHHRPAPDDRRALIDQEAHGHGAETVGLHGPQRVAVRDLRPAGQAQQARLRGAIDVGVEDAGLEPDRLQAQRQIDGGGRLADAALARCYGDHVLDAGDLDGVPRSTGRRCGSRRRRASGAGLLHPGAFRHRSASRRAAGPGRRRPGPARLFRRQHGNDALHTVDLAHDLLGGLAQRLELLRPLRRHRDGERYAPILEQDLRHQPQVHDVALHVGSLDPTQALDDLVFAGAHLFPI